MTGRYSERDKSLYDILGVSSEASTREIRAAYRRLAKQYHPDINKSSDAHLLMSDINDAYMILGDPAKRAAYDSGLDLSSKIENDQYADTAAYAESFVQQVRCQECGRFEHTLRIVAFPYVISFIFMTQKKYEAGIFCNECRSQKSVKHAIISLLFGIWGFPFGIIYTLEALVVNFQKGKQPKEENQELLKQLAWVNVVLGRIGEAKSALHSLLRFGKDIKAREFLNELNRDYPKVAPARASGFRLGYLTVTVGIIFFYGLIGNAIFGGDEEPLPYSPPPVQQTPVPDPVPAPAPKPTPIRPPTTAPSQLITPADSFVEWEDDSGWVSGDEILVRGKVRNAHNEWSLSGVRVELELYNAQGSIVNTISISVIPTEIPSNGVSSYSKRMQASPSIVDANTVLYWTWEPP